MAHGPLRNLCNAYHRPLRTRHLVITILKRHKGHAGTNRSQAQDLQVNSEQGRLFPGWPYGIFAWA